jgi:hypothetical protein
MKFWRRTWTVCVLLAAFALAALSATALFRSDAWLAVTTIRV